jgi:hypothetical protein
VLWKLESLLMSLSVILQHSEPYTIYILSLCWLLKAFSKSTKLTSNFLCHSWHCSKMFPRTNMWSMQPLPFLNPAYSRRSFLSTASIILDIKLCRIPYSEWIVR